MVTVSFPFLICYPFQIFSALFLQLNCNLFGHASHPPSVYQGKKVPPSPSLRHLLRGEDVDAEFSSFVIFFISNFSQHLFTVKLLFNWPCRPPSLSLSRQQEHATTIPMLLVAWGSSDGEFSSCFCFPPTVQIFFSQPLFPVQLLFICCFPNSTSPFISILKCLMFQLKFACRNLHSVLKKSDIN